MLFRSIMMKPMLVGSVKTQGGAAVRNFRPVILEHVMSEEIAVRISEMMQMSVESGTGINALIRGVGVAGKTGTAENELTEKQKNKEHTWFICFAPADDPSIAIAVMMEYSGSTGGNLAAPVARRLIQAYLK